MSIVITDALARAILDTGYDSAFDAGVLEIRTGAPPGSSAAPTGTLLWTFTLPADSFAVSSGRSKQKNGTWSAAASAAGTAGHYRLKASGDTAAATQNEKRQEGTVTATGGGGDMTIDNTNIASGQTVTVSTFSVAL